MKSRKASDQVVVVFFFLVKVDMIKIHDETFNRVLDGK